jgi:hypothetical protein
MQTNLFTLLVLGVLPLIGHAGNTPSNSASTVALAIVPHVYSCRQATHGAARHGMARHRENTALAIVA